MKIKWHPLISSVNHNWSHIGSPWLGLYSWSSIKVVKTIVAFCETLGGELYVTLKIWAKNLYICKGHVQSEIFRMAYSNIWWDLPFSTGLFHFGFFLCCFVTGWDNLSLLRSHQRLILSHRILGIFRWSSGTIPENIFFDQEVMAFLK
jgi:hypothetical protein